MTVRSGPEPGDRRRPAFSTDSHTTPARLLVGDSPRGPSPFARRIVIGLLFTVGIGCGAYGLLRVIRERSAGQTAEAYANALIVGDVATIRRLEGRSVTGEDPESLPPLDGIESKLERVNTRDETATATVALTHLKVTLRIRVRLRRVGSEWFVTEAVPLTDRPDWKRVLAAQKQLGTERTVREIEALFPEAEISTSSKTTVR